MKKVISIILVIISQLADGQNLVPNPSFEAFSSCPNNWTSPTSDELAKATGWSSYRETPDYFNACATSIVGCPSNNAGFQPAHTGNAYCGAVTFNKIALYREIFGRQLSAPLSIGTKYFVSFYVSLAIKVPSFVYASDRIGMKFTKTPFAYLSNPIPVNNSCQINYNAFVTDTTNWTKISGSFVADSAYQYIAIGNFFDDANTDTLCIKNVQYKLDAYYYIDDICVSTDSNYAANWTGIQKDFNYKGSKINLYPNPTSKNVTLEFNNPKKENCVLTIYDIQGFPLQTLDIITADKIELEIKDLTKGIYFLQLRKENEIKATGKLIVD